MSEEPEYTGIRPLNPKVRGQDKLPTPEETRILIDRNIKAGRIRAGYMAPAPLCAGCSVALYSLSDAGYCSRCETQKPVSKKPLRPCAFEGCNILFSPHNAVHVYHEDDCARKAKLAAKLSNQNNTNE